jgi:hypothetical protein
MINDRERERVTMMMATGTIVMGKSNTLGTNDSVEGSTDSVGAERECDGRLERVRPLVACKA